MSKDRRLGRGLAALLGTPIDEAPAANVGQSEGGSASDVPAMNDSRAKPKRDDVIRALNGEARHSALNASSGPVRIQLASDSTANGYLPIPNAANEPHYSKHPKSIDLAVGEIDSNPFQPRRVFSDNEIASLAESLKEHQQLQPILVRQVGDRYQLISGERRLRAAVYAGLATVRAEVREADDRLVAELAIVENLQRKDLDAVEKAMSFKRYLTEHKCSQEELAKRLKIDRSTIANLMRLLELPEPILRAIQSDQLSAGHARTLLPLGDDSEQITMARQIQTEGWSVRETERRVSEKLAEQDGPQVTLGTRSNTSSTRPPKSQQLSSLEQQLKMSLGTKVDLRQNAGGRGKIVIQFANADEFERIFRQIIGDNSIKQNARAG